MILEAMLTKKKGIFSYKGKYEGLKETSTMPFTITDAVCRRGSSSKTIRNAASYYAVGDLMYQTGNYSQREEAM